jgi:hypothetical protein
MNDVYVSLDGIVGTLTSPEGIEEYPAYPMINLWELCANPPIEEVREMALRDAWCDALQLFEATLGEK